MHSSSRLKRTHCLEFSIRRKWWQTVTFSYLILSYFWFSEKETKSEDGEGNSWVEIYVCSFISKQPESSMSYSLKNNQRGEHAHPQNFDRCWIKKSKINPNHTETNFWYFSVVYFIFLRQVTDWFRWLISAHAATFSALSMLCVQIHIPANYALLWLFDKPDQGFYEIWTWMCQVHFKISALLLSLIHPFTTAILKYSLIGHNNVKLVIDTITCCRTQLIYILKMITYLLQNLHRSYLRYSHQNKICLLLLAHQLQNPSLSCFVKE